MNALKLNTAHTRKSWKAIPEFPGYHMSSDKEVRNPKGKIVKQRLNTAGKNIVSFNVSGQFNTTKTVDKIYAELFESFAAPDKFQTAKPEVHTHPQTGIKLIELPGVVGYFLGTDKKVYSQTLSGKYIQLKPYNVSKNLPNGMVSVKTATGRIIRFVTDRNLHLLNAIKTHETKPASNPTQKPQILTGLWLKIPGSAFHVRMNKDNVAEVVSAKGNILVPYGKRGYVSVFMNDGKRIQDTPQNFWDATVALSHNNPIRQPVQTKPVQQSLPLQVSPKASARFTKPENNSRLEVVDGKAIVVHAKKQEIPTVQAKSKLPESIQVKQELNKAPTLADSSGKVFLVPGGLLFAFKISPISDNVWHQIFKDQQELQHVKNVIDVSSENLSALTRGKTLSTVAQKLGFQRSTDLEFTAKYNIVPKKLSYVKKL